MSEPGEVEVDQLIDMDDGVWIVTTLSGARHLLDLDARTITRIKATTPDPENPWPTASLRRDSDPVRLLRLHRSKVGGPEGLIAEIDIREDGVVTVRRTTPIAKIERVVVEHDPGDL